MKPIPVQYRSIFWLVAIALFSLAGWAQAAVICSVSSPGFTTAYVPANLAVNVTPSTFSVTCTRDNAPGPATLNVKYQVAAGNGANPLGTQNRAALAGSFINYHPAINGACATPWKGATLLPTLQAVIPMAKMSTVTTVYNYFGCVPAGQLVLPPEGIYTDTVAITFSGGVPGAATFNNGAFPVSIVAPATCNFTTPPSNVAFAYTSFSPIPVLASSAFGVTCTTSLAYSMALDATAGVVSGLNYTLGLNTIGTGGASPLASLGTGMAQTFFVNGTIAAGQGGTCATATCAGSQLRTLTVTY